jgi:uncharacterized protein YkwD
MKKLVITILILVLAVAGFDYYQRHEAKLGGLANNGIEVINELATSAQKEISKPGGLRSSSNASGAFLTRVGTINQTNIQRQQNGLSALKENTLLNQAAMNKAKDMFAAQYFEHISPIGKGPDGLAEDVNYEYIAIGENLALGNFKNDEELVIAWMNSPGHRANILNAKYEEIGVAVLQGMYEGRKTWMAVQEFGKPKSSCPNVDQNLKTQMANYKVEITGLKEQLDVLRNYLDTTDPKTKQEVEEYNQKVAQFNDLVKIYNNKIDWLKNMTTEYNRQVNAYNTCIGS